MRKCEILLEKKSFTERLGKGKRALIIREENCITLLVGGIMFFVIK